MNKNIKNIFMIFSIIFIVLICNGCWDRKEFDDLALVKGIAVDAAQDPERVKYSVQLLKPAAKTNEDGKKESKSTETVSITGYTLFEAHRNLIKKIGRRPFYGHTEIIVISEEIAKKGIRPYLDYFIRDKEVGRRVNIVISEGDAVKILNTPHLVEDISAAGLRTMVDGISVSGIIISSELLEFKSSLLAKYKDSVCSKLKLVKPEKNEEMEDEEKNEIVTTKGGAFFKGDKLISWLDRTQTRGFSWVKFPEEIKGPVVIRAPDQKIYNRLSIEIKKTTTKIIPEKFDDNFKITIKVDTEGYLIENLDPEYKLDTEKDYIQMNKRYAQVVINEINNILDLCREYGVDILGLGEAIYKKYPKEFTPTVSEWRKMIKETPVEISVTANIRRSGMLK